MREDRVREGPRGAVDVEYTVDQLALRAGTTSRNIRAYQTLGLLPRPTLRGRTGLYGPEHLDRLEAVLRLQGAGFSLAALRALFAASERGLTLEQVLGVPPRRRRRGPRTGPHHDTRGSGDAIGAFDDWPVAGPVTGLAVVPTTVLELVAS